MMMIESLIDQIWAMDPIHLNRFLNECAIAYEKQKDKSMAPGDTDTTGSVMDIEKGVANIGIYGTIVKEVSPWMRFLGVNATSTDDVNKALVEAVEDDEVKEIRFNIDSPGGLVSGVKELADDINAASELKPTSANIDGMAASAAYWLASQTNEINISESSQLGSIGVYSVASDFSDAFEKRGIKVNVVSSHPLKGHARGAPVSDEQLGEIQRNVDTFASMFIDDVARGRGVSRETIEPLATGQLWIGRETIENGLADNLQTGQISASQVPTVGTKQKETAMSDNATKPAVLPEVLAAEERARKAEAKAKAAQEALREGRIAQVHDLISANADRVTPPLQEKVKLYAEAVDWDYKETKAFIDCLPVAVKTDRVSVSESQNADNALEVDEGIRDVCRAFGTNPKTLAKFENVTAITTEGKYVLSDGSVVDAKEVLQ